MNTVERDVCLYTHADIRSETVVIICVCVCDNGVRVLFHVLACVLCNAEANSQRVRAFFFSTISFLFYLQRASLTLKSHCPPPRHHDPPTTTICNCSSRNNKANPWLRRLNFWELNYSHKVTVLRSHANRRSLTHRHLLVFLYVCMFVQSCSYVCTDTCV